MNGLSAERKWLMQIRHFAATAHLAAPSAPLMLTEPT
jgi:hypothetical protein